MLPGVPPQWSERHARSVEHVSPAAMPTHFLGAPTRQIPVHEEQMPLTQSVSRLHSSSF